MPDSINLHGVPLQEQTEEIERFIVFRFEHQLGKSIKDRLKSIGCSWNPLQRGWICPAFKEQEARQAISEAKLECKIQTLSLPKGLIPSDPKIASREARLDILEIKYQKADLELLQDVYQYDSSLRPYDFSDPPSDEDKSHESLRHELDFHNRWVDLQKLQVDIEKGKKEVTHLKTYSHEKVFDTKAPLLITEALIKNKFLFEDIRTLQYCSNGFWEWDGIKYVELSEVGMRQTIYNFLRDAKKLNNVGGLENLNPNKFKVDQVIDALKAICHQKYHPANGSIWLDQREDPNPKLLIVFQNGLLNIEEWLKNSPLALMPHTPLLLNINALGFDFDPHAPDPQEWLNFLNSIWPEDSESQRALQEWAGYCLTQNTTLHKLLLIIGPTRSGKGTIGRIFHSLLGASNVVGPTLSSLRGEFGLQPLLNKMLATISDARLDGRGNNSLIVERILSITGEDHLTINRKFLPALTVQLPTRMMIMTNELPDMQDASGALAKRYLMLTLQKSWYGNEDNTLLCRLQKELPGILLWALRGLVQLQKRGNFLQPTSSQQTITELEEITSPIKAFIAERCEINKLATVPAKTLLAAWHDWCRAAGYPQTDNVQELGKDLRAALPKIESTRPQKGSSRVRCYKGIALIPTQSPSADVRGHDWRNFNEKEED